jgi:hypothetical protein
MSLHLFTNDLPAARAYVANELSSHGYEQEAFIIRMDPPFVLDVKGFVKDVVANTVAKWMALWAPDNKAKAPVRQVPSVNTNSL